MKKINNTYKGIIFIILSAFFFALMSMFVRLSGDLPPMQKAFFRNSVALVFAGAIVLKNKTSMSITRKAVPSLIMRACFGTLGIICNFYAIDRLVLADASILNKMSPFFAIVGSYFILKEKITPSRLLIVIGAFAGCFFIIKPSFQNAEFLPSLIGLIGGFGAGIAYTFVRKLGEQGVKGPVIVFFFSAFSCLVTLPFIIFSYREMSLVQLIYLLLAGLSATGGQFAITAAYIHAPARDISVYDYSQIIFTSAIGFIIFGQVPDFLSIIGYIIIVSMAVTMFFLNKKQYANR